MPLSACLECADLSALCYRAKHGSKTARSARGESADKSAHSKQALKGTADSDT